MIRFFAIAAIIAGLAGGWQILRGTAASSDGHRIDAMLHFVGAGILLVAALVSTFVALVLAEPREPTQPK